MLTINELTNGSCSISSPTNLNVIVGRNGSGKSRFLRTLAGLKNNSEYYISYISPERAGSFLVDPGVEHNRQHDKNWESNNRLKNQSDGFKKTSASKLRELAMQFAVRIENDPSLRSQLTKTFVTEKLDKINSLLNNIRLERYGAQEFRFITNNGDEVHPDSISSGESEAVSLGTEILHFFEQCSTEKINVLFLDEPDVHLHPDLQARLARFIIREIEVLSEGTKSKTFICLATHSSPLLAELALSILCSIGTKYSGSDVVCQIPVSSKFANLAPFFGHPLSKFINNELPFIIEGEDDERVWVQAYRTSQGRLHIFPCLSQSINHQLDLEKSCERILSSIYDDPNAISLRDADGDISRTDLESIGCVKRFRLRCYSIENLLLTDEVLDSVGTNWQKFTQNAHSWCANNLSHQYINEVKQFIADPNRGRDLKIKAIRNIVREILGSSKPWETIVGQCIGKINHTKSLPIIPHSLVDYIGLPFLQEIGLADI